jgi:glycosyltransferase involved in cell wall biosynthesis
LSGGGLTGLLFEPGNPFDLTEKVGRLLDDPALCRRMGLAGRARFEEDFMWEEVIKRYWRPLLAQHASVR